VAPQGEYNKTLKIIFIIIIFGTDISEGHDHIAFLKALIE
jgi:hypothetical protein